VHSAHRFWRSAALPALRAGDAAARPRTDFAVRVPWVPCTPAQEAAAAAEERLPAMYLLEVLSGPLDGKTWTFEREITIGRDDTVAEACIGLDRYVSRQHARLHIDDDSIRLVDLQSRNGTKLNGQPVVGNVALPIGAPFVVGRTILRVTRT
jgi:hypothetical protein